MALLSTVHRFAADNEGVTAIEYALLGALIAAVVAVGATTLGQAVYALYDYVVTRLTAAL